MLDLENQKQSLTDAFEYKVLENSASFIGKYLCWSFFFNKVAGLRLYYKRLQYRCFLWNLQSFEEHLLLQNTSGGCFWKIYLDRPQKGGNTVLVKYIQIIWQKLLFRLVKNVSSCIWRTLMFGRLSYFHKGSQAETAYITKSASLCYFVITCNWRWFCSHWRHMFFFFQKEKLL